MDDFTPTETIFAAFAEMGKRIIVFFACLFIGATFALMSAGLNQLIKPKKAEVTSSTSTSEPNAEWYEESLHYIDSSKLAGSAIGVIGFVLLAFGMVKLIRGADKILYPTLVVFGGSLVTIMVTIRNGWVLGTPLWVFLSIFIGSGFYFRHRWMKKQFNKWQDELDALREENDRFRKENDLPAPEPNL